MRFSVDLRRSSLALLAPVISLLAVSMGSQAFAVDGFSESLVGGLAAASDLTPLIATDATSSASLVAAPVTAGSRSLGRQSVPSADRATSYRDGDLFQNSKVAVPLLVADLEPRVASKSRPMTGRSVGARPSASWTRPRGVTAAAPSDRDRESTVAWAGLSGR